MEKQIVEQIRPYDQSMISPLNFDEVVKKLRGFFLSKNFKETFPQPRMSILAACENPESISSYVFSGIKYPMIQTNQMWLEYDILKYPESKGVFCLTTSYRDEKSPIEGRHDKVFPMFEAEHVGNYTNLLDTLSELCVSLGFITDVDQVKFFKYDDLCEKYNTSILESEHEEMMWEDYGDVVAITHFPERTSPFWNMKKIGTNKNGESTYAKCDFIICGQETIGAAERDTDPDRMRSNFYTISDGKYSEILFNMFGEDRVNRELDDFFDLEFIERWGFGMGMTRLIRAMNIKDLI